MAKMLPIKFPTEDSVKKALKIKSFRELSKDKVMKFASMIPYMDKDVAIAVINQFPTYSEFVKDIISFYMETANRILDDNKESQTAAIHGYQTILDSLSKKLEGSNTAEERKSITDDMLSVADKIAEIDEKNKKFLNKMVSKILAGLGIAVLAVGAGIGISSSINGKGELPQLNGDDNDDDDEEDGHDK